MTTTLAPSIASKRLLPWLIAVAFFMESLDTTILNTAVPAIAEALKVVPLSMKAVLSSFHTLSLAVFIPISGWMADRFGTRRVFAAAIGIFTLGSFLCGISNNIHVLVACRILQGFGGAMMVPVGRLTMVRAFAKAELVRAMSFVAIPALIGPMLGPVAGGFLVGYFNWRVIFFVNLPIGLLGLIMVYMHLPDYREPRTRPLDWSGLVLFGSGVALLSYVYWKLFGEHSFSLSHKWQVLSGGFLAVLSGRLRIPFHQDHSPAVAPQPDSHSNLSRLHQRQLLHAPGHRRNPVYFPTALPGWTRLQSPSIGPSDDAPGNRGHEPGR